MQLGGFGLGWRYQVETAAKPIFFSYTEGLRLFCIYIMLVNLRTASSKARAQRQEPKALYLCLFVIFVMHNCYPKGKNCTLRSARKGPPTGDYNQPNRSSKVSIPLPRARTGHVPPVRPGTTYKNQSGKAIKLNNIVKYSCN